MRKGQFTLEDFLEQLRQMKKLGPLESIVGLPPGGAEALKGQDLSKQEKEFRHMEAMVCGMTPQERRNPHILNARRRARIAKGSGVTVTELNTMMNKFAQMQQMMKKMGMSQVDIPATEVIIRTPDKELFIIDPQVAKVNMMGQETLQIVGHIQERALDTTPEISDDDVKTVMDQTGVSEEVARKAIEEHDGDLAEAIISLGQE
ncbi:TPA: nascent polypeptide-associated complex protein [Candidatus Woesearchaeota archaeon]|nr:nascent polypeptide-associated complex protein [Candidatus Woesearchaeota archaeon]